MERSSKFQWDKNFRVKQQSNQFSRGYLAKCNSYPCSNPIRNVFTGLKQGIEAEGDNLLPNTPAVDRAEFQNCGVGILVRRIDNFSFIRSNSKIGEAPSITKVLGVPAEAEMVNNC